VDGLSRRDVLKAVGLVASGALMAAASPAAAASGARGSASGTPAAAPAAPAFTTMVAATRVASRTDRRPVSGGVFDPTVNKTFISWAGREEDAYVQAYDHGTGAWSAPVRVIGGRGDSHNYPTMVQAANGYLLLFVGMHNDQLVMARSPQPRSISGTWTVRSIAEGPAASYPMPFKTANGNLFVFFRETTNERNPSVPVDTRPLLYVRSTDHGVTWRSSAQITGQAFALGSTDRADHLNEVYVGQLRREAATGGRPERVHLVWTIAGGGPDRHLHDYFHKNIYYATFEPAALRFRNAQGADLGRQLNRTDMDRCRVALTPLTRPGGEQSPDYVQLVGWLGDGRPFVLWMTFDDNLLVHDMASVWTGSAWQTRQVATGLQIREMERLGSTSWRVYANRVGRPDIETCLLTSGQGWTPETVISTPTEVQRIELITGWRDPARILASGISSARDVSVADGSIYVAGIPVA
jgi:BNR repeat-containing family member